MKQLYDADRLYKILEQHRKSLLYIFSFLAILFCLITCYLIIQIDSISSSRLQLLMLATLVDLILILSLVVIISINVIKIRKSYRRNSLQNQIIFIFSLITAIPTILICVFAVYFFIFGIQSWFNNRVTSILDSSIKVGAAYVEEHKIQLKNNALVLASDISNMYYELMRDPKLFQRVVNAYVDMRGLDEAILFQEKTKTILAQSRFAYSFAFGNYPVEEIEKSQNGEIIEIPSSKDRLRYLVKLREYDDTYLIVGKMVEKKVLDYIDQSEGEAYKFHQLQNKLGSLQVNLILIFVIVSVLVLLISIYIGIVFSTKILKPIHLLVTALKSVKQGDFSTAVQVDQSDNEISILSQGFNEMVATLDEQRKDLLIAQKAVAWSEVARRVAHEIKNPLTPMQLAAQRLKDKFSSQIKTDPEKFIKYIDTIIIHIDDITKIIYEFVNFVRMPKPHLVKCDLVILLQDTIELRKILNENISYDFSSAHDKVDFICDTNQFNQVMVNILKNAEEALVGISNKKISITLLQNDNHIIIMANDNGRGFDKGIIKSATNPYVTSKSNGTGLGLSIVEKIIHDHDGSIRLSNSQSGGASIKMTFDLKLLQKQLAYC